MQKLISLAFLLLLSPLLAKGGFTPHDYPSFEEASKHITAPLPERLMVTPSDNLWDEISHHFSLPHYENTLEVQHYINWYMNHADYFYQIAEQAKPYLYYIYQQVQQRHLPTELVLIPVIESAYNPLAFSASGAAGLWQIMPQTGIGYGLKHDWNYDGRLDIIASTQAALTHLNYLAKLFNNNWVLAIAAYNSGEGTVRKAIQYNNQNNQRTTFWTLHLPKQTRDYVPKLMAIATIISHPNKYPLKLPTIKNTPYFTNVKLSKKVDLKKAASFAGIPVTTLAHLNPGYSHWQTNPQTLSHLVLPVANTTTFKLRYSQFNLPKQPASLPIAIANKTGSYPFNYQVRSGDSLWKIANTYHITISNIKRWNNFNLPHPLQAGEHLLLYLA